MIYIARINTDKRTVTLHTEQCDRRMRELRQLNEEWKERYPHSCKSCQATGEVRWTENGAPHGAGYWAMPMQDGCDDCTLAGKCPLCGYEYQEDWDGENCSHCGWNYQTGPFAPPEPECYCTESDEWDRIWAGLHQLLA